MAVLKSVADGYTKRSKENKAIRMAALALVFTALEHPEELELVQCISLQQY